NILLVSFYYYLSNDSETSEIYTLSLHDALPICGRHREHHDDCEFHSDGGKREGNGKSYQHGGRGACQRDRVLQRRLDSQQQQRQDRKSTRLNSSHSQISYAVFCLKKKKTTITHQ